MGWEFKRQDLKYCLCTFKLSWTDTGNLTIQKNGCCQLKCHIWLAEFCWCTQSASLQVKIKCHKPPLPSLNFIPSSLSLELCQKECGFFHSYLWTYQCNSGLYMSCQWLHCLVHDSYTCFNLFEYICFFQEIYSFSFFLAWNGNDSFLTS